MQLLSNRTMWAEQDQILVAPGFRFAFDGKGVIRRAFQTSAASIYPSSAGKAYMQPLDSGHVWALTGTPGARA